MKSKNKKNKGWNANLNRVINDTPDKWPDSFKKIKYDRPVSISNKVEKNILKKINTSARRELSGKDNSNAKGSVTSFTYVKWLVFAAVISIVIFISIQYRGKNLSPVKTIKYKPEIRQLSGKIQHIRKKKETLLTIKSILKTNDEILLPDKSNLNILFGRNTVVSIDGPAKVFFKKINDRVYVDLHFFISYGSIFISSSTSSGRKHIIWETERLSYLLQGAVAQLSVQDNNERLDVIDGAFRVTQKKTSRLLFVSSGNYIQLSEALTNKALPRVLKFTGADKSRLLEKKRTLFER